MSNSNASPAPDGAHVTDPSSERSVKISRYSSLHDERVSAKETLPNWGAFCAMFTADKAICIPTAKLEWDAVKNKWKKPATGLLMFSPAHFVGASAGVRSKETHEESSVVGLDYDTDADETLDEVVARIAKLGLRALVHSTFNYTAKRKAFRILIDIDDGVSFDEYARIVKALCLRLDGKAAKSVCDASRLWYGPGYPEGGEYLVCLVDGTPLGVELFLADLPVDETKAAPVLPSTIDASHSQYKERVEWFVDLCKTCSPPKDNGETFTIAQKGTREAELPAAVVLQVFRDVLGPRCGTPDEKWPAVERLVERSITAGNWPVGTYSSKATREGFARFGEDRQRRTLETLRANVAEYAAREQDPDSAQGDFHIAWTLDRGDSVELAEKVKDVVPGLVFTEGAFFVYDDVLGIWKSDGLEKRIKALIRSMAGTPLGERAVLKLNAPAIGYARDTLADMVEDKDFFVDAAHGISCPNGFLQLTNRGVELVPHSSDHRARSSYPVAYDANATSARWETFLQDLFIGDVDSHEKIALLGEFFGGALFGLATMFQRCIIARGDGGNGKSKLLEILASMFPPGSVVAFSPQNLEKEYWRARLPGVLLNAVAEMPSATVMASENFKAIITGDEIDAREPMKPVICFKPRAGHFFGANSLPGTTDQSFGFWRRFLVIAFDRNFEAGGADKDIVRKVLTDSKEAIFAWLAAGAVRLVGQQGYTVPSSHEGLLKKWRHGSDSVASWREEQTVATDQPSMGMRSLYRNYQCWAKDGGYTPVAENVFGERLAKAGFPREGKAKWVRLKVPGSTPSVVPLRRPA